MVWQPTLSEDNLFKEQQLEEIKAVVEKHGYKLIIPDTIFNGNNKVFITQKRMKKQYFGEIEIYKGEFKLWLMGMVGQQVFETFEDMLKEFDEKLLNY